MQELELLVVFSPHAGSGNQRPYWYNNIELFIIYGTTAELLRGKFRATSSKDFEVGSDSPCCKNCDEIADLIAICWPD